MVPVVPSSPQSHSAPPASLFLLVTTPTSRFPAPLSLAAAVTTASAKLALAGPSPSRFSSRKQPNPRLRRSDPTSPMRTRSSSANSTPPSCVSREQNGARVPFRSGNCEGCQCCPIMRQCSTVKSFYTFKTRMFPTAYTAHDENNRSIVYYEI